MTAPGFKRVSTKPGNQCSSYFPKPLAFPTARRNRGREFKQPKKPQLNGKRSCGLPPRTQRNVTREQEAVRTSTHPSMKVCCLSRRTGEGSTVFPNLLFEHSLAGSPSGSVSRVEAAPPTNEPKAQGCVEHASTVTGTVFESSSSCLLASLPRRWRRVVPQLEATALGLIHAACCICQYNHRVQRLATAATITHFALPVWVIREANACQRGS